MSATRFCIVGVTLLGFLVASHLQTFLAALKCESCGKKIDRTESKLDRTLQTLITSLVTVLRNVVVCLYSVLHEYGIEPGRVGCPGNSPTSVFL